MPSRRLILPIALGLIGLAGLRGEDPAPVSSRMGLVPSESGAETIAFALSPDGRWVATARSDGHKENWCRFVF